MKEVVVVVVAAAGQSSVCGEVGQLGEREGGRREGVVMICSSCRYFRSDTIHSNE